MNATVIAVRQVYCCCSVSCEGSVGPLGKKMRNRSKLLQGNVNIESTRPGSSIERFTSH
jgi:hypothetical protein